jgi:hypothetical protein
MKLFTCRTYKTNDSFFFSLLFFSGVSVSCIHLPLVQINAFLFSLDAASILCRPTLTVETDNVFWFKE